MAKTSEQFANAIKQCRNVYEAKLKDYGCSWRVLRPSSLTDQIFIKANRIRSIQTKGNQQIEEGIVPEFIGIVNYSIIALIQLELGEAKEFDLDIKTALALYDKHGHAAMQLMLKKNHDYDEAWRSMRISSMLDLILMKLLRLKQIEDNQGKTIASEGVSANYDDILNYSIFSLIKLSEEGES